MWVQSHSGYRSRLKEVLRVAENNTAFTLDAFLPSVQPPQQNDPTPHIRHGLLCGANTYLKIKKT
jgi:hypothetical protein